jgi:2-oxoglutarate ferredoxin oxidoreductase subunit gamma
MRTELRLSGTGGQGLILAGIILAEAALLDGKLAVQSQSYGPEARGGASKAEVIISEDAIHFTKVTEPDIVLFMSQEAADKFSCDMKSDTILVTDSLFVKKLPNCDGKIYELPITHVTNEKLGRVLFSNIVAVGAINAITNLVKPESLEKAVLSHVPAGTEDKNRLALQVGRDLIK